MALYTYLDKENRSGIVECKDVIMAVERIEMFNSVDYILTELNDNDMGVYELPPYEWKWVVRHNVADAEYALCRLKDTYNLPW